MGVPVKKLNQQHPTYSLYTDVWERIELLNAGGVRIALGADRFLMKRPKEMFDVYQERIRRFRYQNILGTSLGWYTAQLFRQNPHIDINPEGTDKWYSDIFLEDCDRARNGFVDKFREIFGYLVLYGAAYILTDKPRASMPVESRADEKQLGLDDPYLVTYSPRQVINWGDDENGNLDWIVIKCEQSVTGFLKPIEKVTRWYYFDRQVFRVYEAKTPAQEEAPSVIGPAFASMEDTVEAELIDEGPHVLAKYGINPVNRIAVTENQWLASRVYLLLLDHINQHNAYSWALFMSNLAMPVIFSDKEVKNLLISETAFLQLGETDKLEWLEPKGNSFEQSAKYLQSLREEIYRSMYLQAQGRNSSASASSQSGYSKEMDMMPANDALNGYGDVMRRGMQDVGNNVAKAKGDAGVAFDVSGFKFETQPLTQAIGEAEEMADLGIFSASATLEKTMLKTVALQALEDRNDDLKQKVMDEIDAAPTSAERDAAAAQAQQDAFAKSFNKLQTRGEVQGEQGALAQGGAA